MVDMVDGKKPPWLVFGRTLAPVTNLSSRQNSPKQPSGAPKLHSSRPRGDLIP